MALPDVTTLGAQAAANDTSSQEIVISPEVRAILEKARLSSLGVLRTLEDEETGVVSRLLRSIKDRLEPFTANKGAEMVKKATVARKVVQAANDNDINIAA